MGPALFIPRLPVITDAQRAAPQLDAALLDSLLPAAHPIPVPTPTPTPKKKGVLNNIKRAAMVSSLFICVWGALLIVWMQVVGCKPTVGV